MKVHNILPLADNNRTGSQIEPQMYTSIKGLLNASCYLITTATITFTIEGRMESSDDWITLETITEADIGTSLAVTQSLMREIDILPNMRVVISNGNVASFSNVYLLEY